MGATFVTGATGFIGSHVTRLLAERGDDLRLLVREGSALEAIEGIEAKRVRGDILDRRSIRRAMQGVERVFHIAGTTSFNMTRECLFQVNVEGTRIVLEEALRADVERIVYTSSAAAIGPAPAGRIADEHQVWDAGRYAIPYVDSKHEAEVEALRLVARGLPLVIVNPAHVLGPGDLRMRSSTTLVRRFMRRELPFYVDGTVNIVGVEDVARGHLLADQVGRIGERYILGNRNFTIDRLIADLARLSGIEPSAIKLPAPIAIGIADLGGRLPALKLPSVNEVRAASLNWAFRNAKARRELGWRTSQHEDCLEATIEWYREREGSALALPGSRPALPLRLVGGSLRQLRKLRPPML
jgi:dihydroflavonol-4-reductase